MINHRTQNHGMRFTKDDYQVLREIAKKTGLTVSQLVNRKMGLVAKSYGYEWEGLLRRGNNQFKSKDTDPA
jgi:hypothetical protein